MATRTTIELVPLLASLLVSAPTWALEPCHAVSGAALQCGRERVRVRGISAPERGEALAEQARENLQRVVMSGEARLDPRARDRHGRVVADLYVGEVRIRQKHVGGDLRAPIDAASCSVLDGDTLRCGHERVRVRGVYSAERGEKGAAAAQPKLVRRANDRYGRTVADLYVDGRRIRQKDIGPRRGSGAGH